MEGGECALSLLCKHSTSSNLGLCPAEVSHGTVRTLQQLLVATAPPSAISKGRAKPALCAGATHGKIADGRVKLECFYSGSLQAFVLFISSG